ncbi:MAG: hypothetical protein AAFP90_17365, partial [Planctomycetota bacterium]
MHSDSQNPPFDGRPSPSPSPASSSTPDCPAQSISRCAPPDPWSRACTPRCCDTQRVQSEHTCRQNEPLLQKATSTCQICNPPTLTEGVSEVICLQPFTEI